MNRIDKKQNNNRVDNIWEEVPRKLYNIIKDIKEKYKLEQITIDIFNKIIMNLENEYEKAQENVSVLKEENMHIYIKNHELKMEIDKLMIINLWWTRDIKQIEALIYEDYKDKHNEANTNAKAFLELSKL